jgi:hypothetical protein
MKKMWFLRFRDSTGSITAETAISIIFLAFAGFALMSALSFAIQYQRLQTLAQEASRTAASLEDPHLLEIQIKGFLESVSPDIGVRFDWQTDYVTVTLEERAKGLLNIYREEIDVSASAPRWSG